MITRYACGHVGKMAGRKVKRFIRVAEIRRWPVTDSDKQCPICKHAEGDLPWRRELPSARPAPFTRRACTLPPYGTGKRNATASAAGVVPRASTNPPRCGCYGRPSMARDRCAMDDSGVSAFHEWSCGICRYGGWPLTSAYRPHTLERGCWCAAGRPDGMCGEAITYGFAQIPAGSPPVNPAVDPAAAWRAVGVDRIVFDEMGIRITARELRDAYRESLADLREQIRAEVHRSRVTEWSWAPEEPTVRYEGTDDRLFTRRPVLYRDHGRERDGRIRASPARRRALRDIPGVRICALPVHAHDRRAIRIGNRHR